MRSRVSDKAPRRRHQADKGSPQTQLDQSRLGKQLTYFDHRGHGAPDVGHLVLVQPTTEREDSMQHLEYQRLARQEREPTDGNGCKNSGTENDNLPQRFISPQGFSEEVEEKGKCVIELHLLIVQCQGVQHGA